MQIFKKSNRKPEKLQVDKKRKIKTCVVKDLIK